MKDEKENSVSAPVQPGPRPKPTCPKCGGDELSIASGIVACSCWSCDYEADFAQFFPVAAPSADMGDATKEAAFLFDLLDGEGFFDVADWTIGEREDCLRILAKFLGEQIESLRRRVPATEDVFSDRRTELEYRLKMMGKEFAGGACQVVMENVVIPLVLRVVSDAGLVARLTKEATTQGTPEGAKWERQEACFECDGDGCPNCEDRRAAASQKGEEGK